MEAFTAQGFIKNHRRPLQALRRVRTHLEALKPIHETEDQAPLAGSAGALARRIQELEDRLVLGPDAPLIVSVLGATGTGKSKIFNSIIGASLSPSGYKRPTTMAPVLSARASVYRQVLTDTFFPGYEKREVDQGPVEFNPAAPQEMILAPAGDGPGGDFHRDGLILVDTPDFDSVLAQNRTAAQDVFDRSDAVIFITDAIKYADQAAWDYLERIRQRAKEAVLVVNRVDNPISLEDFSARLARAGLSRPLLSLPDMSGLTDTELISGDHQGIKALREQLTRWTDDSRESILFREAQAGWAELRAGLMNDLIPGLQEAFEALDQLKAKLVTEAERLKSELDRRMTVSISGELKNSLITQIQALFQRWDLMRYPRRIMALPFTLVRDKVLVPLGVLRGSSKAGRVLEQEIDRLFEANGEAMVAVIYEYNRRAAEHFSSGAVGRGLIERPDYNGLVWTAEQVREAYQGIRLELEDWVHRQAADLVKNLNLGEKMTFYLAQVVSLSLFVSIQIQTGGGFSFFDGLLDSALAPILSKITGSALSRDKVKAFEEQAARIHLDRCRDLIDRQAANYLDFLIEPEEGLAPGRSLAGAVEDLDRAFDALR